ncbi:MAG TPA: DUF4249 family protein [Longimicrobiaceae bacterium]|nr:DUF4249 family protein [Longimicrobiaceae bacterium]
MGRASLGLLGLLGLLLAGCELLRPPTDIDVPDQVQLHYVLRAGSDTVAVLIEEAGTRAGALGVRPVSGARVRIAGGGVEVELREAPTGFPACKTLPNFGFEQPTTPTAIQSGCYAAVLPGGVRVGETYTLRAELPGGGLVTGRNTVPRPPEVVRPAEGGRLRIRRPPHDSWGEIVPFAVTWRIEAPGEQVALRVLNGTAYRGGAAAPGVRCDLYVTDEGDRLRGDGVLSGIGGDSIVLRGAMPGCRSGSPSQAPVRPDSVDAAIHLVVLDTALARYGRLTSQQGIRAEHASIGITGANGVFGSTAAASRSIRFVFEAP